MSSLNKVTAGLYAKLRARAVARGQDTAALDAAQANSDAAINRNNANFGKAAQVVAPIAALAIPGLGPLAAAALAAGGSAYGKDVAGQHVDLGSTLAEGAAVAAARGLENAPRGSAPIGGTGTTGAASGTGRSLIGTIGDLALKHPELIPAAISAVNGAGAGGKADALRVNAINNLAAPRPVDLTSLYTNPANPYSGRAPINTAQAAGRAALVGR